MTLAKPILTATALAVLLAGCGAPGSAPGNASVTADVAVANDAVVTPPPAASPADAAEPSNAADPAPPAIVVDGEGLRFVDTQSGSTRPVPFGSGEDLVLGAFGPFGQPRMGANRDCDEGPIRTADYDNGLTLHFQEGRFAGWFLSESASADLTTMAGLHVGSTRADLNDAYAGAKVEESSIGQEFMVGDMGGVLDGTGQRARVTALWAGAACIMR